MQEQESGEGRNAGHSTLGGTMSKQEMEIEMIALKAQYEVDIEIDVGDLYIRQENPGSEEPDLVIVALANVPQFVAAIQKLMQEESRDA